MGLARNAESDGKLGKTLLEAAASACFELIDECREAGCTRLVTVATAAFRNAPNAQELLSRIESHTGPVNVIDPLTEGRLFFEGVVEQFSAYQIGIPEFVGVDVGGGSVQVVWKDGGCCSVPTGTYILERQFQPDYLQNEDVLRATRVFIGNELKMHLPSKFDSNTLILGSGCMADFLHSAMSEAGLDCKRLSLDGQAAISSCSVQNIDKLLTLISQIKYQELARFFPEDPRFMYGADKALMNLLEVASICGAEFVYGTNESLATSIVRTLSSGKAAFMDKYGITVKRLN